MKAFILIMIFLVVKALASSDKKKGTYAPKPTAEEKPVRQTQITYTKPAAPEKQKENDILARANRNVREQQEERRTETVTELKARLQEKYGETLNEKKKEATEKKVKRQETEERPVAAVVQSYVVHEKKQVEWQQPSAEDLMKEVSDLMVKGYDGNLTFTRDFVAEGIEMLNQIQM